MGWQPETQPKGNLPKIIYLCDGKKECNDHMDCGQLCKHTADIRHAVNFINIENEAYVEERPTIDAEPVRHGKWITEECLPGVAVCSICGHEIRGIGCQYTKYCDECGARMDEE